LTYLPDSKGIIEKCFPKLIKNFKYLCDVTRGVKNIENETLHKLGVIEQQI